MDQLTFLFPGQGSQHVGMGQELYAAEPLAREVYDRADEILGFPLSELCFSGPAEVLTDTLNAQPAILSTSMALLSVFAEKTGARPTFVAGHSLGEYTALVSAGVLAFPDALQLVHERGRLMKEAGTERPGGMAAILGLDTTLVAELCRQAEEELGDAVQVANDNCPGQVVISGARTALDRALELALSAGAKRTVPLQVSIASHSALMAPAAAGFEPLVTAVPLKEPDGVSLVGNATGQVLPDTDAIRTEMVAQLTHRVRWTESMRFLLDRGVSSYVEIGPGDVLTKLMRRIDRKAKRVSIQGIEGIEAFQTQEGRA